MSTGDVSAVDLPNGRDVGGRRTRDGHVVREGVVYRSGLVALPEAAERAALLGIRTAFDLRTVAERQARPNLLPAPTRLRVADVLADDPGAGPSSLAALARRTGETGAIRPSSDELHRSFRSGYRSFVTLDSARAATGALLRSIADSAGGSESDDGPWLVHCTAGKDRTGWLVATLLLSLGVSEDVVMQDYLSSAGPVWEMFAPYRQMLAEQGVDMTGLSIVLGVREDYLQSALQEMRRSYGDLDGFLAEGVGLTDDQRQSLADRLLV